MQPARGLPAYAVVVQQCELTDTDTDSVDEEQHVGPKTHVQQHQSRIHLDRSGALHSAPTQYRGAARPQALSISTRRTLRLPLILLCARATLAPRRASPQERVKLSVLEAALATSEYTDKVDVMDYRTNKTTRMHQQLDDLRYIISGLMVAAGTRDGRSLLKGQTAERDADLYASVFEVGRRFKIMSPDKMRTTYGKLVHALMDAAQREVQQLIGFNAIEPIQTVYGLLSDGEILGLLDDPDLEAATKQIVSGDAPTHAQHKAAAIQRLCATYSERSNGRVPAADVERVLLSIGDANAFLAFNRQPVERAQQLLYEHFSPKAPASAEHSLAITIGREGARLSHSHGAQFAYVDQSLRLWNEVISHFYRHALAPLTPSPHSSHPSLTQQQPPPQPRKARELTLARAFVLRA
jgi:hypothetical protein